MCARWRLPLRLLPQAFDRLAGPPARALWARATPAGVAGLVIALRRALAGPLVQLPIDRSGRTEG
jgi:hypothetical protein